MARSSVLLTIFVDEESLPRRELGRFASSMTSRIRNALGESWQPTVAQHHRANWGLKHKVG